MINHGARSDDPDESPGAAVHDHCSLFLAQDHRHHPGTLRQNPEAREASLRLHGGGSGGEMLSRPSSTDMQVCERS